MWERSVARRVKRTDTNYNAPNPGAHGTTRAEMNLQTISSRFIMSSQKKPIRWHTNWTRKERNPIQGPDIMTHLLLSEDENERRLSLYNQGLSDARIAKIVHRSQTAITKWRHCRDLPTLHPRSPPRSPPSAQDVISRHNDGESVEEISKHLNAHPSSIRRIIGDSFAESCLTRDSCIYHSILLGEEE